MKAFLRIHAAGLLAIALPVLVCAQPLPDADGPRPPATRTAQPGRDVTRIWTDHLALTTYPGQAVAAPGDRASLVVEIEPGEGMHVYAPGAERYRVITLILAAQPFVRQLPMQYPPSEIYVFAPLDERVPVYQEPFTLRQALVLETTPEARAAFRGKPSLNLTGTLEYQACDDRICFNPVSVPLSWTLKLESGTAREGDRAPDRR